MMILFIIIFAIIFPICVAQALNNGINNKAQPEMLKQIKEWNKLQQHIACSDDDFKKIEYIKKYITTATKYDFKGIEEFNQALLTVWKKTLDNRKEQGLDDKDKLSTTYPYNRRSIKSFDI